jgi:hypothetical protein
LTDEHIIADGLGGDLLYLKSSCLGCARHTNSFETPVINGQFQYARGVAGVRSRKRKFKPLTARVQFGDGHEDVEVPLPAAAPFFLTLPISDNLPDILTGAPPEASQQKFPIAVFGHRDWNERARKWVGEGAKVHMGYRGSMGQLGQLIAKIAHSYACAKLGLDGFSPFLLDHIRANRPAFDSQYMGIYSSEQVLDHLHHVSINVATGLRRTVIGMSRETVYLVAIRLFANHPSPMFLAIVGRPIGSPPPGIPVFGGPTLTSVPADSIRVLNR